MAKTYVKGDAVENATSYELHEKASDGTYSKLAEHNAIDFEVSALGLEEGEHTLVVRATAEGYENSDYSNEVVYTAPPVPIANLYNFADYPVQNGYYGNSIGLNSTDKSVLDFVNYRATVTTGLDIEKFPVEGGKTYSIKLYNAPTTAIVNGDTNNDGVSEVGEKEVPYFAIWGLFFYETINGKPSMKYMYTICNNTSHIAYWNTSKPAGYTGSIPYTETNSTDVFKINKGNNVNKIVVTNLTSGAKSCDDTYCVFGNKANTYTQSCQVEINDPAITHMTVLFGDNTHTTYQMASKHGVLSAEDRAEAIETIQNGLMIVEGKKLPSVYFAYEE